MKDEAVALVRQTANVQSARQLRFTNLQEIVEAEALIASYVADAIEVEKSGRKVQRKETAEFNGPEELQQRFDGYPAFKSVFDTLTPGRQCGYLLHFASAKQSKTRMARIEKAADRIFAGKGLND